MVEIGDYDYIDGLVGDYNKVENEMQFLRKIDKMISHSNAKMVREARREITTHIMYLTEELEILGDMITDFKEEHEL